MGLRGVSLLALVMMVGCIDTPENGATVYESQEVAFSGYSLEGNVELQYEVITGYHADPSCPPPTQECWTEPDGERLCRSSVPDCKGIADVAWKSLKTVHTGSHRYNLFADVTETFYNWETRARLPAEAFHEIQGRDGSYFRGARVRAVLNGNQYFYTVKPGGYACWQANQSKWQQWVRACTPSTSNTTLELRSAGR